MAFQWMMSLAKTAVIAFLLYQSVDYLFYGTLFTRTAASAYLLCLTADYLVYDGQLLKTAALACLLYFTVDYLVDHRRERILARKGNAPLSLNLSRREQVGRWQDDAIGLVDEAYKKFPGRIFQVYSHKGPQVFIPRNMMDEVNLLPDNILSISAAYKDFYESDHSLGPDPENQIGVTWTRNNLGQRLDTYTEILMEELLKHFFCMFSLYPDWQPIQIHPSISVLVGVITGRILVGPLDAAQFLAPWISDMYIYHDNISEATDTMARFPRWVLSLTSMSNGPITLMSNCREYTKRVAEIVEEVLKRPDTKDAVHGINGLLPEDKKQDYLLQARSQIGLSLAAFNTTVRALYNVIFDLVEHPENLRILREELFDVFCTNYPGKLPRYTIDKFDMLLKMDSVIKESMRLHGGDVGSFRRKLLRGVTLSDGTHLPEGTTLLSPTWSLSHDASIFPDPDTFDGLRFFNMPPASRPQLTTVDNTATYFGAGRHACPGRAFASRKIKMFLIHLLMSYDLKLVDGDTEPRDSQSDGILAPNREKNIMIRNLRTL